MDSQKFERAQERECALLHISPLTKQHTSHHRRVAPHETAVQCERRERPDRELVLADQRAAKVEHREERAVDREREPAHEGAASALRPRRVREDAPVRLLERLQLLLLRREELHRVDVVQALLDDPGHVGDRVLVHLGEATRELAEEHRAGAHKRQDGERHERELRRDAQQHARRADRRVERAEAVRHDLHDRVRRHLAVAAEAAHELADLAVVVKVDVLRQQDAVQAPAQLDGDALGDHAERVGAHE
ncbi:hypothetical protein PybrP1_005706 [[Pythium] brassicae (nom. inval.)]|nr:hypothetical protein PybrP1_005706 [[Pythium] brassicae (nom. inval.)]